MKILLATNNNHKLEEVKNILKDEDIEVVSLSSINDFDTVKEDGKSFEENAYIKAKYYYDKYHMNVLSDDSGLCVEALDNKPGIYSARYASDDKRFEDNNSKLLYEMKNKDNRNAKFVCNICYIEENGNVNHFVGEVKGKIGYNLIGENGFGYDPLFMVIKDNIEVSFASLDENDKNKMSHRYKALKEFKEYLKK